MTTMTKADWEAVARAEAEFSGRDGDWHRCHRAVENSMTDAVDCFVCGDTDEVRLCAPDGDELVGCGEGYCPRHYTPAQEDKI